MRLAQVYERKGKFYVFPYSRSVDGVWVLTPPVREITGGDFQALAAAVQECLAASETGVPHPKPASDIFRPVLDLAGVRSWSAFVTNAKGLKIESDKGTISVIPTTNRGAREGYDLIEKETLVVEDGSDGLAEALTKALALCR